MKTNRTILFSILAASLALAACGKDSTTPSAVSRNAKLPADDVIYGLHHVMTKAGVRIGVMESDTAYLREAGQKFDLVGVRLTFYNESGAQTGSLTSRTGEYVPGTGAFIARGNAVLVTQGPNGQRKITTEELHYDRNVDQMWSDKPFVFVDGPSVTRGNSFRSDTRFEKFSVTGAATQGGIPKATGTTSGISF